MATIQLNILKYLFLKICLLITAFTVVTAFADYLLAFPKSRAAAHSKRLLENSFTLEGY